MMSLFVERKFQSLVINKLFGTLSNDACTYEHSPHGINDILCHLFVPMSKHCTSPRSSFRYTSSSSTTTPSPPNTYTVSPILTIPLPARGSLRLGIRLHWLVLESNTSHEGSITPNTLSAYPPNTNTFVPTATAAADLRTLDMLAISVHWSVDGL